jgi:hypothetical protein
MSSKPRDPGTGSSAWLPVAIGHRIMHDGVHGVHGRRPHQRPAALALRGIFGPVADARWEIIHHYIRKSGHFFGYGFIGLAWLRAWWMTLPHSRFLHDALLALLGTALVASCDEWHQTLSAQPHRLPVGCAAGLLRLQLIRLCLHADFQAEAGWPEQPSNIA